LIIVSSVKEVKSSSLDPESNRMGRQMVTTLASAGIQNSAYSLAKTCLPAGTKESTIVDFFVNINSIYDTKIS